MTEVGHINVGLGLDDAKFKKGLKDAQNQTLSFAKTMKTALAGIAAGFTVGAIVRGINASVEAFRTQEIAVKSLNQALSNAGVYSYEYSQHLQQLASDIQKVSNYGDEATIKAISLGQAFAGNVKMTDELIKATVDFAAATSTDLDSAFKLIGRSIGSQTNALSRYGVELDKNMSATQRAIAIQTQLGQKFEGSAEKMANKSIQLKNAIGDASEDIGEIFNPSVEEMQKLLIEVAKKASELAKVSKDPLQRTLKLLSEDLKAVCDGLSSMRDFMGKLIPGTNNFSATLAGMTEQVNKLGIAFKGLLLPLKLLSGETTIKDLTKDYGKLAAQWRGETTSYYNAITGGQFSPLLKGQEAISESVNKVSGSKGGSGSAGGGKTLNQALEEYNSFVANFKQATDEYNATIKARNYVEKTLGIGLDSSEFQSMVNAYRDYYMQLEEIANSHSVKKAELMKLAETKLQQDLQRIELEATDDTARKHLDKIRDYEQQRQELEIHEQAYQSAGGFLGSLSAGFTERLRIKEDFLREELRIEEDMYLTSEQKAEQHAKNMQLFLDRSRANAKKTYQEMGQDIVGIFENSFTQMLTNSGSFSDNMKQLMLNLGEYIVKQALKEAIEIENIERIKQAAYMATYVIKSLLTRGMSAITGAHTGHTFLPTSKHHYGGSVIPQADQTEHFALIKNNERVLSPSETAAYNQGQNSAPNYVVYSPVVKAMDSKDVASWFNENKQQVLNIVATGIKNNEQQLRTQIQGV